MTTAAQLTEAAYDQGVATALTGGPTCRPFTLALTVQVLADVLYRQEHTVRLWRLWWLLGMHWVALQRAYHGGWEAARAMPVDDVPPMPTLLFPRPSEGTAHPESIGCDSG